MSGTSLPPPEAAPPVPRDILVNRTSSETRVAVLEAGRLVELWVEREESRSPVGNLYKGRVATILPGMQSAFVSIGLPRDAFLHVDDLPPLQEGAADGRIEARLRVGAEIIVQIQKEPIPGKGARVTCRLALPGRFVVLIPGGGGVGVSRRIEDPEERARLRAAAEPLRPQGSGIIVRTAGEGAAAEDLAADVRRLAHLWDAIVQRAAVAPAGTLLHAEFDPVRRLLRDGYADDAVRLVVDDGLLYRECVEFLRRLHPGGEARVEWHRGGAPLFDRFDLEGEIQRALRARVWLKSGGYLVIQPTEALVAIDVNTGKFVGKRGLEETALRTNLEAAAEVVRQIRLRDLGGIIVVDFIDMRQEASKRQVLAVLQQEMARDRAKSRLLQISDFGLVEITRQRRRGSLDRLLCRPCPACGGSGRLRSAATAFFDLQREVQRLAPWVEGGRLRVRAHPDLAVLVENRRGVLAEVLAGGRPLEVDVEADETLPVDRFEIASLPA